MTPAQIAALSPEDRTQLLRTLATDRYGPTLTLDKLADEMDIARRTAFDWVKNQNPPLSVLFALQAWADIATVAVKFQRP